MLLAQTAEVSKIVGQALTQSSEFGAMTYVLVVFLLVVACERGANFWWIVKPESITRRETEKSIASSLNTFAVNSSATVTVLQEIVEWQKKVDSGIRDLAGKNHCEARSLLENS